jgi:hypothetical protein
VDRAVSQDKDKVLDQVELAALEVIGNHIRRTQIFYNVVKCALIISRFRYQLLDVINAILLIP